MVTLTQARRRRPSRGIRERNDTKWFWVLTTPWLAGFLLLSLVPLIFGLVISLTNYNGVSPDLAKFIGIANYVRAVTDPNVASAAIRSIVFVVTYVPLSFS